MSSSQNTQSLAEPRARGVFTAGVLSNDPLCPEHYRLRLGLESFPPTHPGQFINIQCNGCRGRGVCDHADAQTLTWPLTPRPRHPVSPETTGRVPLLRRPFSLAGRADAPDGSAELEVLYRVVGAGSNWLCEREIGDEVNILGPLGKGFTIREDKPLAAVIGGGTGIGPMIYLSESLLSAGRSVMAFVGARSASALPLREKGVRSLFEIATSFIPKGYPYRSKKAPDPFFSTTITTDDGSLGQAGMVHEAFAQWLEREKPVSDELVVYACGPEEMMKTVADICTPSGIECQLAMERHMACGMGVCQGCAIKVKTDEPPGWMFKLVCKDGPVFDAEVILWE